MEITDIGKKIIQAIKESESIEASQLVLEMQSKALQLQDENYSLRRRVDELERRVSLVDEMTFDGKVYWRGEGDDRDGPYCQRCLDGEGRAIRLQLRDETVSGYESRWYECHSCQIHIQL